MLGVALAIIFKTVQLVSRDDYSVQCLCILVTKNTHAKFINVISQMKHEVDIVPVCNFFVDVKKTGSVFRAGHDSKFNVVDSLIGQGMGSPSP